MNEIQILQFDILMLKVVATAAELTVESEYTRSNGALSTFQTKTFASFIVAWMRTKVTKIIQIAKLGTFV